MSAFKRLSPHLQHAIADRLRWSGLRPVQEVSIPPILAGENVVVLAPTAGGKTEAAFLPVLDLVATEGDGVLRVLYVSPLVALLNNQELRVDQLTDLLGLRAFKWHGGVGSAARKRFLADPAEVLLTTPESLEAMLIGRSVPVAELFRTLRFVIVDEVHAFAGSDRGAHLIAVLERIAHFAEQDVQRIGLSATVQNPVTIGRWFKGSSNRTGRVVRAPGAGNGRREALIHEFSASELDRQAHLEVLTTATSDRKTLLFTESRSDAEVMASHLIEGGGLAFVGTYHSAISTAARAEVEARMDESAAACIACTSAMELGIDLGDLDDVLQWGTPPSVSSLLQRWGRSGRRAGQAQRTTIYTQTPWDTLTALALVTLTHDGWVEPIEPSRRAYHILFQQILNLVLQHYGTSPGGIWNELRTVPAFADITRDEFDALLRHLLDTNILSAPGGTLVLGDAGERKLGGRHFQRLIVSFETPEQYTLIDTSNHFEVGTLELLFVEQLRRDLEGGEAPVIMLAGRAWQIARIVDERGVIEAAPHPTGKAPKWQSHGPRLVHAEVAKRHRELLDSDKEFGELNNVATAGLEQLRQLWQPTLQEELPFRATATGVTLMTFAGSRVNFTIERFLASVVAKVGSTPFEVTVQLRPGQSVDEVQKEIRGLRDEPSAIRQQEMLEGLAPVRLSKYQPFLPAAMAQTIVSDYLLDYPATIRFLESVM